MHLKKILILLLFGATACKKEDNPAVIITGGFEETPLSKSLVPGVLDEASGIADSKTNPGFLWVQQDSGNPNDISLLSHAGNFQKKVNIKTAVNRDWEDMVIANGPVAGTNYIYLADIGDNSLTSSEYYIYRFAEPATGADTIFDCDKISFRYSDGAHNAEAILVDNTTKDIYIITKNDTPSKIYKLAYPQSSTSVNTTILAGILPFSGVTGAAFSPDGKKIIIKTYTTVYYWKLKKDQSAEQALADIPVTLSYQSEPQGEAICFKNDNAGFFTLSERPSIIAAVNLNFYKRK
jgi:hypothetical protein